MTATVVAVPGELEPSQQGLRFVRHELKNALSAASVHLELLARSRGPEGELDRIEAVRDALDQALGLSERLAGDPAAALGARVDIALVVRQCSRLARPLIERRGELSQNLPTFVGQVGLGEVEAREVVLNLLLNAGQALEIGRGGRVRVSARAVDGHAILVVEDDGVGMCEETLEQAFVPGFTSKADGSGYGLARVRDLVQKADGHVRIQSSPGSGTRVVVELPLTSEQPR